MRKTSWAVSTLVLAALALTPCWGQARSGQKQASKQGGVQAERKHMERLPPAEFGQPFELQVYNNLNPNAGPASIDPTIHVGKRPIVLYYWIAGNVRSEQIFKEVELLWREIGSDKLALYGIAFQQPGRDARLIRARLEKSDIRVPVLDDDTFRLGQLLRIQQVPNIAVIGTDGTLRFSNGGSLKQPVEANMSVADVLRRAADGKTVGLYGYLDFYHPVYELVGKKSPAFSAKLLNDKSEADRKLYDMLAEDKLNVFIYWSVDCGHCRQYMPEFAKWVRDASPDVNVVTAAVAGNEALRIKTREFCAMKQIELPTLLDAESEIGTLYNITTTPTVLLIRPDRTVHSVLRANGDYAEAIEAAQRELGRPTS